MKFFIERQPRKIGWEEKYRRYVRRLEMMNRSYDLERFRGD
ncbi:MAG: hypothetical protein ACLP9S_00850 [Syntrophales bacterium]